MRSTKMIIALAFTALVACVSPKRTIKIPESVMANPKNKDAAQKTPSEPFVVKYSDGKHIYEVHIPQDKVQSNFSFTQPLDGKDFDAEGPEPPQTEADREIIDAKKQAGEPTPKEEPGQPPKAKSYLTTLARVTEMFKRRQYELALIQLTALDREYPDDERVLEMKGTLYWKLRRPKQARESWERALALNPNNAVVAQALEQLAQDGE